MENMQGSTQGPPTTVGGKMSRIPEINRERGAIHGSVS